MEGNIFTSPRGKDVDGAAGAGCFILSVTKSSNKSPKVTALESRESGLGDAQVAFASSNLCDPMLLIRELHSVLNRAAEAAAGPIFLDSHQIGRAHV